MAIQDILVAVNKKAEGLPFAPENIPNDLRIAALCWANHP